MWKKLCSHSMCVYVRVCVCLHTGKFYLYRFPLISDNINFCLGKKCLNNKNNNKLDPGRFEHTHTRHHTI